MVADHLGRHRQEETMIVSLIIVIIGGGLLLVSAFSGLFPHYGRRSDDLLIAPRNAGFGTASRVARSHLARSRQERSHQDRVEATRERARADLAALTSRTADPA